MDTCTEPPGKADVSPQEGAAPPTPIRQVTLPGWGTGGPGEQSGCTEAWMESNLTEAEVTGRKTARLGLCLIIYFYQHVLLFLVANKMGLRLVSPECLQFLSF